MRTVVIGSGMGGLAVAQVLSKHFESVIVVEKDQPESLMETTCVEAWQEGGKVRPGVLQVSTELLLWHSLLQLCETGHALTVHISVTFAVQPDSHVACKGGSG